MLPLTLGLLVGCASTTPSSNPFEPVRVSVSAPASSPGTSAPPDDAFAEPEPIRLSSEEMAQGTVAIATAAGVDLATLAEQPVAATPAPPPVAPLAEGLPPATRWPVRLVSTVANAQPPRAILGLPNGQEIVVAPGSMIADQGLVVVSVSNGAVELAQVTPNGDHAVITPITLTSQYP